MATNAQALQKTVNAAIEEALQRDPTVNGTVYVAYDNQDLGISEDDLKLQA